MFDSLIQAEQAHLDFLINEYNVLKKEVVQMANDLEEEISLSEDQNINSRLMSLEKQKNSLGNKHKELSSEIYSIVTFCYEYEEDNEEIELNESEKELLRTPKRELRIATSTLRSFQAIKEKFKVLEKQRKEKIESLCIEIKNLWKEMTVVDLTDNCDLLIKNSELSENYTKRLLKDLEQRLDFYKEQKRLRINEIELMMTSIRKIETILEDHVDKFEVDENDLSVRNFENIKNKREELFELQKEKFEEMFAKSMSRLTEVWNMLDTEQRDRDAFMEDIDSYSLDGLTLIEQEINLLQGKAKAYHFIKQHIEKRDQIKQEMIDFEVSASDPKRLFRPSFQLMAEEKFRKTAFPSLLRIESKIRTLISEFEANHGTFLYKSKEFLPVMEKEIKERHVNENVFGFHPEKKLESSLTPKKESNRQSSSISTTITRSSGSGLPIRNKK